MKSSRRFSNTLQNYQRKWLADDLLAGLVVAILVTPQSIAYALLAGLPPQAGLYAALLPVAVYAFLGSSPLLAVGPVAIISLMTFEALHQLAPVSTQMYMSLAAALAMLSGLWLLLFWLINLGRWTTFISQSVISAFTAATALLIVVSQAPHLMGVMPASSADFYHSLQHSVIELPNTQPQALILSFAMLFVLFGWQRFCPKISHLFPTQIANLIQKFGPLLIVVIGILAVQLGDLNVTTVGILPAGLPHFNIPDISWAQWQSLLPSSGAIALISYLSSLSASEAVATRSASNNNNQELLALGAANIAAAVSQSFPIAGSFSRSVVNLSAGAKTQMAGLITVLLVGIFCIFANDLLKDLPQAVLAVIIIVSAWPLISFKHGINAWRYQKSDGLVWAISFFVVLISGAENGILLGMLLSIILYLKRTSEPHIAEIGRIANSDHFRNVKHYDTLTSPHVLLIRIDENLYFANSRYLIHFIKRRLATKPEAQHVVLVGSAINHIDYIGLQTLHILLNDLREQNIQLHLAEFKNPVIVQLKRTELFNDLAPGKLFFNTSEALRSLSGY
ncbi:MAG TPA: sulfate permease [Pseudomonadales bacterium]|nr:sulfate permease [Pseudomonadales bacterium]